MYRILIVDDEMVFRKGIAAMLRKSDFSLGLISEAVDGCEALELLEQNDYDIVITDIRMPRMDGLMLCRSIREKGLKPGIVILSGYDDFKYAQTAIQYGVSDYVLKPVSQRKLAQVLQEVIRKREESGMGLSYSQMDSLVTGLANALWNQDREAWQRAGQEAAKALSGLGQKTETENCGRLSWAFPKRYLPGWKRSFPRTVSGNRALRRIWSCSGRWQGTARAMGCWRPCGSTYWPTRP